MKAIITKFLGPTNTRGSRITARDSDGNRTTVGYRHEISGDENHDAAAVALCRKMGWKGNLVGGSTKDGRAYVFVGDSTVPLVAD